MVGTTIEVAFSTPGELLELVDPAAGGYALLDVDDTLIEVDGYGKQGAGFDYNGPTCRSHRRADRQRPSGVRPPVP